ncbi:MAG TPA: DUF1833 family protein [Xanthobacteraceae bacterium]
MPGDPTLDEVLQEAYASASPDKILIDTISIYYDGLVDGEDNPAELYLFNGENSTTVSEAGVPMLTARIEDGAARKAGELVTYLGISFKIVLAPMNNEPVASAMLTVDSVGREMNDALEAAAKGGKAIEVTYRLYVKGQETVGPQSLPPRKFVFSGAEAANASVNGRLAFLAIGNRAYPFDSYRPENFRTLQFG